MTRPAKRGAAAPKEEFDRELVHLSPQERWREWMGRVEAVIFAAPAPVDRKTLARVVGDDCNLDLLVDDICDALRGRPYELVAVAGGWQHRTRPALAEAIRAAQVVPTVPELSRHESLVLMAVGYFQPVTRGELSRIFGRQISRDTIAALRSDGLVAAGPRSPQPGAPYTYVTTSGFLVRFGFESLRDLPDFEKLEEAGLLSKEILLAEGPHAFGTMIAAPTDEDDDYADDDDDGA